MRTDYKVGDTVQSAPTSSDVLVMGWVWRAEIVKVIGENDHGGCYETLGFWDNEPYTTPTLRQLWGDHFIRWEV